ncbi:MAG: ABC transporter permease, partial [Polyangiaceae bacterium]|nr:ABC transporter permease [Polyangiaceae bacterium]
MSGGAVARALRAYPTLLRVGFAGAIAYRAEMLIWMLTTTMPLVSLALWSAVAARAPVGRFGAPDFTAYFLATLIVRQLTGSWLVWEMNMDIKSGALSQRLLKPVHPLVVYSSENLAAIPLRALLCVPVAGVALLAAGGERWSAAPATLAI